MVRSYIRVKDGYKLIMEMFSPYRRKIYEYNESIKDSGYYLKPVHVVIKKSMNFKYLYFGRYWYRVIRGEGRRLRWIYVGREKPDPNLPEPPLNPFEGLKIIVDGNDVVVDDYVYRVLVSRFKLDKSNTT